MILIIIISLRKFLFVQGLLDYREKHEEIGILYHENILRLLSCGKFLWNIG